MKLLHSTRVAQVAVDRGTTSDDARRCWGPIFLQPGKFDLGESQLLIRSTCATQKRASFAVTTNCPTHRSLSVGWSSIRISRHT